METKNSLFLVIGLCITQCMFGMERPAVQAEPAAQASQAQTTEVTFEELLDRAKKGDADAQYLVAECYFERKKGAPRSEPLAIEWFEKSAAQGHIYAAYRRGFMSLNDPKQALQIAVQYLKQAAAGHEPIATYQLSLLCKPQNRWRIEPAVEQEVDWLKKTIQDIRPSQSLDDPEYTRTVSKAKAKAAVRLAELCETGYAQIQPSTANAITYYTKALEFFPEEVRAKAALARLKRDVESLKLLLSEAAETDPTTQCFLGKQAYNSERFSPAVECFRKVAADAQAQYYLGLCCAEGKGTTKDTANALAYFRASAEQGYAPAIVKLQSIRETDPMYPGVQCVFGILHRRGIGLAQNDRLAVHWLLRSYEGRCGEALTQLKSMAETSGEAQYAFGMLHETGQLAAANVDEAIIWYEKALLNNQESALTALVKLAEANITKAIFVLARYHESRREYEKCREWLGKAVMGASAEAAFDLGAIYLEGRHGSSDEKQAIEWYAQAAELHSVPAVRVLEDMARTGNAFARYKMGALYENGKAFKRDLAVAEVWYKKALDLKYGPAFYRLAELLESRSIADFKTPEEIIACYRNIQELYRAAAECGVVEALLDLERLKEVEMGITEINVLRGERDLGKIDFRNIVFTKLRAELSAETSYEMCYWVAHICAILTQFYSDLVRDAVCLGIKTIDAFGAKFGRKDRLAQIFLKRIADALLSDTFLKNPLKEKDEGLRLASVFTLCRGAAILQRDTKDICTKQVFKRAEGSVQDILIDVFNKYLLGEQKVEERVYRSAVAQLLALFKSVQCRMTPAMLWDDEYQRHGNISSFENLLTHTSTDRYKQRIVKMCAYVARLSPDMMAAQFASWAVAGIHCATRAERETLKFVVANATNASSMDSEKFGLEMRIAVCLAKRRKKCIEDLVAANEREREHQLACLEKKVSKELALIGDAENFRDGFASVTLIQRYRDMSPEIIVAHVLRTYDEVRALMEEYNMTSDSTITYNNIYQHFEQLIGDKKTAELMRELFSEDGPLTARGASILLYYFGYFE